MYISPDKYDTWTFFLESTANSCVEATDEVVEALNGVYTSFDDFIMPIDVWITKQNYNNESGSPYSHRGAQAHQVNRSRVTSEDGVSFQDIKVTLPDCRSNLETSRISYIRFYRMNVKIKLDDGEYRLGQFGEGRSRVQQYRDVPKPEISETGHPPDLLRIDISHLSDDQIDPNGDHESDCFYIFVESNTDIWFEDSDIGRKNRERLLAFFERIVDNLPVYKIKQDTVSVPSKTIELDDY